MAHIRAFTMISPMPCNQLLTSTRSTLLTGERSSSFVLSKLLSSLWVSHTGSAPDWCVMREALYKSINTIQYTYNTC